MALITFMSDLGHIDHYVALVKAKIFEINPDAKIIDISHAIEPFNLAQSAYILKSAYKNFPEGTIHMVAVDSTGKKDEKFICIKLDNHFFLCTDNGLMGLISENEPTEIIELETLGIKAGGASFPEKNILAAVAANLSLGHLPKGKKLDRIKRMMPRQFRATKNQISGNVIYVDHYGNLITNIEKAVFEKLKKERSYRVVFGRESADQIFHSYYFVEEGDAVLLFNDDNLLEIAINKGNASELLGMNFDSPVTITFQPEL